jgi:hypothetical protein
MTTTTSCPLVADSVDSRHQRLSQPRGDAVGPRCLVAPALTSIFLGLDFSTFATESTHCGQAPCATTCLQLTKADAAGPFNWTPCSLSCSVRTSPSAWPTRALSLGAIARAVRIPFAELLEHPTRARLDGRLLDLPPTDWPPGDARPCFATRDQQAIAV